MYNIDAYKLTNICANVEQIPIQREWMEKTDNKHAYNCFPVSLTNRLGWGLSFPEDISFIWDGISDSSPYHVKILKGEKYLSLVRGNASVSFKTGLTFITKENLSILSMPVPNLFIDGISPFTTIISSSWYRGEFPLAVRVTKSHTKITIPANTPIASIIPISLSELNNSTLNLYAKEKNPDKFSDTSFEYSMKVSELNQKGKWSNFYRNATDHKGNVLGKHETKSIKLNTIKDENE